MEEENIEIYQLNADTFEREEYKSSDASLMLQTSLDTSFDKDRDYIEFYIYDENKNLIYPENVVPLTSYSVREGDVLLSPSSDLKMFGFDTGKFHILYNFYRKRLNSDSVSKYYIKEISSDRTEIRLASNNIPNDSIAIGAETFNSYRNISNYFVDFYLNFGQNNVFIANNLVLDTSNAGDNSLLIKLYEALPLDFDIKSQCWVVEQISDPQLYQVNFPFIPRIVDSLNYISGPNFNLNIKDESGKSGQLYSYNTLLNSDITSSNSQLKSLLAEKQININVNYEDFNEFVHFSSAKTRLENFYYKVGLIESASKQISDNLDSITSDTSLTNAFSSSKAVYEGQINDIIKNFDGYEYFLYFNSGSSKSYPKLNSTPPYNLYPTGSTEVLNWIGSADPNSTYYGGMALSASDYDQENQDWLYWAIPEYLRTDPENARYELFLDMMGQHYDNVWLYTKDISKKYDADNRIDYGVSRDIVAQAIRDFGIKLYSNNFNTDDLYTAFLGLTPSGSLFPFPEITDTLPADTGFEYVDTKISSSNDVISLDSTNKRLYKRIYHNIPYLLKTKGTIAGLRSLITSYGIPDTILRINEFGGKDKNENQNWDYEQRVFNYAFDTGEDSDNFVTSSFNPSNDFRPGGVGIGSFSPSTVQFRFKSAPIPTGSNNQPSPDIRDNQLLWLSDRSSDASFSTLGTAVVLEYTGSGFTTGSYSGSIASPYDTWGTLKFYPDLAYNSDVTCSVFAPFFNGDWWSVQLTYTGSGAGGASSTVSASLFAANEIDGKVGFSGSELKLALDSRSWERSNFAALNYLSNRTINSTVYQPFSGSFQEYRMFAPNVVISESKFFDYTLNPYSNEGNTVNGTPDELMFRAALGTQLDTGSGDTHTSIHPRVTGSAVQITQSFSNGTSDYYIETTFYPWVTNVEKIYQDQVIAGIKNRITDKIQVGSAIIPERPSGSNSSVTALSALRPIQQSALASASYSPSVDYLEVAFSPQDQINDDINAQIGYFNLGDYIGDPRQISSSARSYPDLDTLRDEYFEKYIKNYDVLDFVRLIKFFDNSLFKMIKDFTPARTSLSSGVVVKQHLLERNRQRPAQASWSNETYSGSIKPQSRNYNTGSSDFSQYSYTSGSSIYRFSGGTGGSFERYNGLFTSPSASAYGLSNRFNLTQSFSESIAGSVANQINNSGSFVGYRDVIIYNQEEFYDGEFSGSSINLPYIYKNPTCANYLKVSDKPIFFNPIVFSLNENNTQGTTIEEEIVSPSNSPVSGDAWIVSQQFQVGPVRSKVKYIRLSNLDINGVFIGDYLDDSDTIQWITSDGTTVDGTGTAEYKIDGVTTFADSTLLRINQDEGDNIVQTVNSIEYYPITSSIDGGSENWSLIARGNFSTDNALSQSSDKSQQGNFQNDAALTQTQYFWYYNGDIDDAQGFFNTGSSTVPQGQLVLDPTKYPFGSYNPKRTSNIPWFFSCSFAYSASDLGSGTSITASGIYHSASHYSGVGLTDQDFTFNAGSLIEPETASGRFVPSPQITSLNPNVWYSTYNNLIPGDSSSADYSVDNRAGHPRVKIAGTASLDFYFPSLTIGGTKRTLTPDPPQFTPISGSSLETNSQFQMSFDSRTDWSTDPIAGGVSGGQAYDGGLQTDWQDLYFYVVNTVPGGLSNVDDIVAVKLKIDELFITASVQNYTASIRSRNRGTGGEEPAYKNRVLGSSTYANVNREVDLSGVEAAMSFIPTGVTDNQSIISSFRIEFETPEENFKYWIEDFKGYYEVSYSQLGGQPTVLNYRIPQGSGNSFSTNTYQGSYFNTQKFTASFEDSGDEYPQVDIVAKLMRTGSGIPKGGYQITSSLTLTDQEIFGGKTFEFQNSPILNIFHPGPNDGFLKASSSINNENDIYFIEYSMSRYDDRGVSLNRTFDVEFLENGDTGSKILFEQRADGVSINEYDFTGSLLLAHGNTSTPTSLGSVTTLGEFIIPESESVDRVTITGSFQYPFRYDDTFRMGISVSKSFGAGLNIQEYTMSIFPSSSIYAELDDPAAYGYYKIPTSSGFIIPSYFGENVLPFNLALDCQPLLNNYNDIRPSTFLMDVDYNNVTGSILPVNQEQILANTATRATVPDSNYTILRSTNPRYNGSKSTSRRYNIWGPNDEGTYGQLPTIDLKKAYFSYFNEIEDPYPNINDKIKLNVRYLIDEEGNALPPALEGTSRTIFERVYPIKGGSRVAIETSDKVLKELNSPYEIGNIGNYYAPIMYTQTSSKGYASEIPLTGSGRISRYDNDSDSGFDSFAFTALGEATTTPSSAVREFNYIISPTEEVAVKDYATQTNPYSNGIINYNGTVQLDGGVLKNDQTLSLETQFVTSYIYDTNGTRNEAQVILKMVSGSTNLPFEVTSVNLSVLKSNGKVYDLGNVMGQSWLEFIGQKQIIKYVGGVLGTYINARREIFNKRVGGQEFKLEADNTMRMTIDWEMYSYMRDKGVYLQDGDIRFKNPDLLSLIWTISANSAGTQFKENDQIHWEMSGSAKKASARNQPDTVFFPEDHQGPYTSTRITTIGAMDHLFDGDNTGSAPFWVYTGSTGVGSSILDPSILVMSSSNVNEAYGADFYQGRLPYVPGPSEFHPSGQEPSDTNFDPIIYPLTFEAGDEIRFGNNENYTYTIQEVFKPSQNVEGDGIGRIKIVLDRNVPTGVNKDFYLIRRKIPNANSIYLNGTFPYGDPSSGSAAPSASSTPGILYPDFPTTYLENSASVIVNNLVSKGLIT